jgi:hypothetical protein
MAVPDELRLSDEESAAYKALVANVRQSKSIR